MNGETGRWVRYYGVFIAQKRRYHGKNPLTKRIPSFRHFLIGNLMPMLFSNPERLGKKQYRHTVFMEPIC